MKWDEQLAEWGFVTTAEYVPPRDASEEWYAKHRATAPMMRRTATGHGMVFTAEAYGDVCSSNLFKQVKEWKEGHPEVPKNQALGLTITESDREVCFEHPAYGSISVCRFSGTTELFGAKVRKVYGGVVLRISQAAHAIRTQDGVYSGTAPRVSERQQLIEVKMSMAQWGEVVTASMGGSIPCTITDHPEHGRVTMPDDPQQSHQEIVRLSANQHMQKAAADIRAMMSELAATMKGPGPLKATEKQHVWERIEKISRHITDSLPFLGEQFDEAMQESLAEARTEMRTNADAIKAALLSEGTAALPSGGEL